MKLIPIALLTLTLAAQITSTFEVKEIDSATVKELAVRQAALDTALEKLAAAQRIVAGRLEDRDLIVKSIQSENGAFRGECSGAASSLTFVGNRPVRTVEIRGKYALITAGSEPCYLTTGAFTTLNNGGGISNESESHR